MFIDYRWENVETARRANWLLQSVFIHSSLEYGFVIPGTTTKINRITILDEEQGLEATRILRATQLLPSDSGG